MSTTSQHTDPLGVAFKAMVQEAVAEALAQHEARCAAEHRAPGLSIQDLGLEPLRAYPVKEAARLLGTTESAVYKIDEGELPRVRRNGTAIGFLGIHIMGYMHRLPPVDVAGCVERMRRRMMEEAERARPTVRPLHSEKPGKTRVM